MEYDLNRMINNARPQINLGLDNLENAQSIINSIDMPSDFEYCSKLRSIEYRIIDVIRHARQVDNWISETFNKIMTAENANKVLMGKLISDDWENRKDLLAIFELQKRGNFNDEEFEILKQNALNKSEDGNNIIVKTIAKLYGIDTTGKPTKVITEEILIVIMAKFEGIDNKEKTSGEILEELMQAHGIENTNVITTTNDKRVPGSQFGPAPLINQSDYLDVKYGNKMYKGNIGNDGCMLACMCMAYCAATNQLVLMDEFMERYPWLHSLKASTGSSSRIFQEGNTPEITSKRQEQLASLNLKCDGVYGPKEAFENDTVRNALEDGKFILLRCTKKSPLTKGGHYILITGITEDGNVIVNDPYGGLDTWAAWGNYGIGAKKGAKEVFSKQYPLEKCKNWGYPWIVLDVNDSSKLITEETIITEKTTSEVLEELKTEYDGTMEGDIIDFIYDMQ